MCLVPLHWSAFRTVRLSPQGRWYSDDGQIGRNRTKTPIAADTVESIWQLWLFTKEVFLIGKACFFGPNRNRFFFSKNAKQTFSLTKYLFFWRKFMKFYILNYATDHSFVPTNSMRKYRILFSVGPKFPKIARLKCGINNSLSDIG